jgi:hypothetical protein
MISIDFVPGSHGNFLEYICNKFVANVPADFMPFNSLGACHNKSQNYQQYKIFIADHYSLNSLSLYQKIIRINFDFEDLLAVSSLCFLRAGDSNIDIDTLEFDTYNKLMQSKYFSSLIDRINVAYPEHKISEETTNCPRYVLREFFKFGFKHPELHGLIQYQNLLKYPDNYNVFDFNFKDFYNYKIFCDRIHTLSIWYGNTDINLNLKTIWNEFIKRQIYKNNKNECDFIIDSVINLQNVQIKKLTLLQESYINGKLEKTFNLEMPFVQPNYFTDTKDIIEYLCL